MSASVRSAATSPTNQQPPGYDDGTGWVTASATRDLPTPPTPVSVTSRHRAHALTDVVDECVPSDQARQRRR